MSLPVLFAVLVAVGAALLIAPWVLDTVRTGLRLVEEAAARRPGQQEPAPPARHRRSETSPRGQTATGVIRRIDPAMLPDRRGARR